MSRKVFGTCLAGAFLWAAGAMPATGQQAAAPAPTPTPSASPSGRGAGSPDIVAGIPVNYDETKTGNYTLLDPLRMENGTAVRDARGWAARRAELVKLFEENQHGKDPGRPSELVFDVFDKGTPAFDGKALRKQVRIYFRKDKSGPVLNLVSYTPAKATGPSPLLLNISFGVNSAVTGDPGVAPGMVWNAQQHKRIPAPAGRGFGRVDIVPFLDAGIGFATFYYGDLDPDDFNAMADGVRQLYLKPGQKYRKPDEWGSLGAWAWGMSRAVDYFETDKAVDAKRIAITGASRLGKTVMWAGAHDTRIAAVIASVSGEGGAAISRRNFGETIAHYVAPSRYPYQFAANYARFAAEPESAPIDGNLLVALIAPRPLLLQTGSTDFWSDPKGEFISAVDASRVYQLLGKTGVGTTTFPAPGQKVGGTLSYFMHDGPHGVLPGDWAVYIDFLKTNLKP